MVSFSAAWAYVRDANAKRVTSKFFMVYDEFSYKNRLNII
jgi:hypothetical protein